MENENDEFYELGQLLERRRAECGIEPVTAIVAGKPLELTAERIERLRTPEHPRVAPKPVDERIGMMGRLINQRGSRYQACRFDNFEAEGNEQTRVVQLLKNYCSGFSKTNIGGLILFGPKGTGKDHLMMACAHAAITQGVGVDWINGAEMRGDVRDGTKSDELERDYVNRLFRPAILWISDPLPVSGPLTEAQQDRLFRVLDGRYSACKPTWVTVNVANAKELDERLGGQNGDRLRDGALAMFCNWPSYRKTVKP
jgi:DNA replication protein DnaC